VNLSFHLLSGIEDEKMIVDMNQDTLIKNAVFMLLTNTDKDYADWGIHRPPDSDALEVGIHCTINGFEVDITRLIREVNSSFENRVKEAAQEIVKTQLVDLMDSIYAVQQSIGNTKKELRLSSIYFNE
jgi:hypothetical protein